MMLEDQQADAQRVLDELFSKQVLPFKLSAEKVESLGEGELIVRFYDSRIHSIDVSWSEGQCFMQAFRTALVDRLCRLKGRTQWDPV